MRGEASVAVSVAAGVVLECGGVGYGGDRGEILECFARWVVVRTYLCRFGWRRFGRRWIC